MKNNLVGIIVGSTLVIGGITFTDAQINPYTDTGLKMEMVQVNDVSDAGESKIELVKSRPEMRMKKWNGEVDLGVSYAQVKGAGNRPFLSNKMEWKDAKEEVHAYPVDDGFEFEIVLNEKPATNVFCFVYTGVENLAFYKQLPLWQEQGLLAPILTCTDTDCDTDGDGEFDSHRPENIVNSFSVYYNKSNHKIGSLNYATGKAFHRFRIEATDANGNKIFGDSEYKDEEMCDTISADWLNNATYPVKF